MWHVIELQPRDATENIQGWKMFARSLRWLRGATDQTRLISGGFLGSKRRFPVMTGHKNGSRDETVNLRVKNRFDGEVD